MAEGTIKIANIELDTPIGYTHGPIKAETRRRAIRGNMLINRAVSLEDQPISKYPFIIIDIVNSKMLAIKAEAAHIGNLDYIDYLLIEEVLSGDGTIRHFWTQRRMSDVTPVPTVTVAGVDFPVTVDGGDAPPVGEVYAQVDDSGRAKFTFRAGEAPADVDDNIIIEYEPKYLIHIPKDGFRRSGIIGNVASFTLICEEV